MTAGVDITPTTGTGKQLSYSAWVALAVAIAAGGALGLWSRFFGAWWPPYFRPLAALGSPWVLTAFAVGAVSAKARPHRHTIPLAALSGAAALVFATWVFYFFYGTLFGAVSGQWTVISMAVGAPAAVAGALWWRNRTHVLGLVAVVVLSAVVAGEALLNLQNGLKLTWLPANGGAARVLETNSVHMAVMTLAVLLPLVLLPRWRAALTGVFAAAVLTWPASELILVVIRLRW